MRIQYVSHREQEHTTMLHTAIEHSCVL